MTGYVKNAKPVVLVVDDDMMNLRMAEFILEQEGYSIVKADSGMECLNYLKDNRPDLILLDIEMPVMSGIKTLEVIRENPELDEIPVMFLTAAADVETVVEAGTLGVTDYIKKPFFPDELAKRVRNAIAG